MQEIGLPQWNTSFVKEPAAPRFLLANWLAPKIDLGKYSSLTRHDDKNAKQQWLSAKADLQASTYKDVASNSFSSLVARGNLSTDVSVLGNANIIGKFDNKVWLLGITDVDGGQTDGNSAVIAVDQHAMHERLRLEKFEAKLFVHETDVRKSLPSGKLVRTMIMKATAVAEPVVVTVTDDDDVNFSTVRTFLNGTGKKTLKCYGIDSLSYDVRPHVIILKISVMPLILRELFDPTDSQAVLQLRQFLTHYIIDIAIVSASTSCAEEQPVVQIPQSLQEILASFACKGAIKFNDDIDRPYFEHLLQLWTKCRDPWHCAHGRPAAATVNLAVKLTKSDWSSDGSVAKSWCKPLKVKHILLQN